MRQKMGVLGPVGTHSEAAARYLMAWQSMDREIVCFGDIGECLHAVETGAVDSAFVPVENSLEGAIAVTLDALARSDTLRVRREVIWPVHNYLMARRSDGEIRVVYSHAQPIAQCRDFLLQHYPQAELIKTASTARAAEIVGASPVEAGAAAICTRRAGVLNGLVEIAGRIEDRGSNCTRFFEVVRDGAAMSHVEAADTVLLVCQIDGTRPGALYDVLGEFAHRVVNLTRIESRPARTELGAYLFFFDLDAHSAADAVRASINAVAEKSVWLKVLGVFSVHTAHNE
ncbi:prephenate dehydratase [Selenomonas dianae]|uniref:Prephenate dehydratase n=1 Tax=Selenomonas dianae TaxID=135079 RepID=A0ABN0TBK7_9FIRM|nr:prephenate dehydratase [Selenomonas dianae]WLD82693.1 prephenate dehydratase [Selenomonas dianae]